MKGRERIGTDELTTAYPKDARFLLDPIAKGTVEPVSPGRYSATVRFSDGAGSAAGPVATDAR
jgi:hypothetical protein